jgi:hypothetical protein
MDGWIYGLIDESEVEWMDGPFREVSKNWVV